VIEDFFVHAGPLAGVHRKETRPESHVYRFGKRLIEVDLPIKRID
jgi:hypothetical protein